MKHILINFYRSSSRIYINNEGMFDLLSQEGTTQGCPLAMAMYALALVPLVKKTQPACKQVWCTDDETGCDKLINLRKWYGDLLTMGPLYGYYPNPSKCILVVKPDKLEQALLLFKGTDVIVSLDGSKDTGIEINTQGTRHLGAAVGTHDFKRAYAKNKIANWVKAVMLLATVADTEPHAAYTAYTRSLQCQWSFIMRVMTDISDLFEPLEQVITTVFLKSLLKRDVNANEREILSLPARLGGLGIVNPVDASRLAHDSSIKISEPLIDLLTEQATLLDPRELYDDIKQLRLEVDIDNDHRWESKKKVVIGRAPDDLKNAVRAASEKGASSWVTALPSYEHDTVLHKGDFRDAIYIRYGWALKNLPERCACDRATFNLQHALDCPLGGLRTIQHNETRDAMAQTMREAGLTCVEIEPKLQPLSGELFELKSTIKDDEARADIKCTGLWKAMRQAFFDVKVISPYARSYADYNPAALYKHAEAYKMRQYAKRVQEVEKADFMPLVFTCAGGIAPKSLLLLKRLAEMISEKQSLPMAQVSGFLRVRFSFALLRTTILCIRATRRKKFVADTNYELALSSLRIDR